MPTNPSSLSQDFRNRNLFAFTAQCSHCLGIDEPCLSSLLMYTNAKGAVRAAAVATRTAQQTPQLWEGSHAAASPSVCSFANAKGQDIPLPEMTFHQCQGTHSSSGLKHWIEGHTLSVTNSFINPRLWSRKVQSGLPIVKYIIQNIQHQSRQNTAVPTCFRGAEQPACIITKAMVTVEKCMLTLLIA